MAPTVSKLTEIRDRLVAQVVTFMGTSESNFFGRTIYYLDYPPDANDIFTLSPILAIYPSAEGVEFATDERRQVALNTTHLSRFTFRGYTEGGWAEIEALEVDCRRAVLENAGLSCTATSSLWERLEFAIEIQNKDTGVDRRCTFESILRVTAVEEFNQ